MHIFRVTENNTGRNYLGISKSSKFDGVNKIDPAKIYKLKIDVGLGIATHINCSRRLIKRYDDYDLMIKEATAMAKKQENNPLFDGVFNAGKFTTEKSASKKTVRKQRVKEIKNDLTDATETQADQNS